MGKGGKVGSTQYRDRRIRSKDKGSDESDEDYTVGEDEEFHDSDESLGDFEEEEEDEEEEEEEKVRKSGRSKGRKVFPDWRKIEVGKASKKRSKVEDDEDFEVEEFDDDEAPKKRRPKIEDEDFEVEEYDDDETHKKRRPKLEDDEDFEVEDDEDFEVEEDYEFGRSKGRKVIPDRRKNEVGKARNNRRAIVEDDEDFEVGVCDDDEARKKRRPKIEDDDDFEGEEYDGARKKRRRKLEDDEDFEVEDDEDFEVEDDEDEVEEEEEEEEFAEKRASYRVEDDEDFSDEDFDDDDDDEFAPDDIDLDNEDELAVRKKNKKVARRPLREKCPAKGRKRKRSSSFVGKTLRKNRTKNLVLRKKSAAANVEAFIRKNPVVKERSKKSTGQRKRKFMADPDSDFMSSGSSDYEYSISEEEREQVREASTFCRDLTINLRNPSSTKRLQDGVLVQQRKRPGRKGKEKVEELKIEVVKQVCGICLSEEGKTTVRGTLNCCSHYFCFGCIMEWSKVESRCPLCKQRFVTISKPARSNVAIELRTLVVQVPERDQVYQPSEEELRGYLDPYESVICTECHHGGDDAFMLLCDICDSPAHTYCVGLGHEVPEGNWYCEGCRPIGLGYSNPQAPNLTPDQRTTNNSSNRSIPDLNVREAIDLNSEYVPESPSTQRTGVFLSPRHPVRDSQAGSPVSGAGVSTLSQRRRILQIHHLLNNRIGHFGSRTNWASAESLGSNGLGSQITPESLPSQQTISLGRLPGNFTPSVQRDLSWATSSRSRDQLFGGQTSNSDNGSIHRMMQAGLAGMSRGINSRSGYEQPHPFSTIRSSTAEDSMGPYRYREVSHFNTEKEQVKSMVRSHLKSLSKELGLGYSTFKDIARNATHTILAACGLQHRGGNVYLVQPPSLCDHVDKIASGEISLMKGYCSSCFDSFVMYVVREITNTQVPPSVRD